MKLEKVMDFFKDAPIICPLCKQDMHLKHASFICAYNHCYDLSSKGYINLAKTKGDPKYDKALFTSRKRVLETGYYNGVLSAISNQLPNGIFLLDAGCGEGYYANALSDNRNVYGIDLARPAIEVANKEHGVKWIVGDLAALPFKDNSFDAVINILSPGSYNEFKRVLRGRGMLIKAVPGEEYLQELRQALHMDTHSPLDTISTFNKQVTGSAIDRVHYTIKIKEEDKTNFFNMTPLTFHANKIIMPDTVTIDMYILKGYL